MALCTQVAAVVQHPALVVTRNVEWGTVIFGFEQANRYTIYDQDGQPVALMAEDVTGFGNEVARQLLRTRRNFTATVFNAAGAAAWVGDSVDWSLFVQRFQVLRWYYMGRGFGFAQPSVAQH